MTLPEVRRFPIKFDDSEERIRRYAQAARTARASCEKRGEEYEGSIMSPADESLEVEERDLEVGRGWVESQREELQGFMDDYSSARRLVVGCNRFNFPDNCNVRFLNFFDTRTKTLEELFHQLDIDHEEFKGIFEFGHLPTLRPGCGYDRREDPFGFTGTLPDEGKQRLADILGKELYFVHHSNLGQLNIEPEVYSPDNGFVTGVSTKTPDKKERPALEAGNGQ